SVHMGPMRDPAKKKNVVRYIEKGLEEGAILRRDGRQFELVSDLPDTCFVGPTIFEGVTTDMAIAREEIFGPVANMMKARTMAEGIAMIHDNPHGNAASIFTQSGKWAREFQYAVECGNIGVNIGIAAPMAFFPFSGMKDSFFGTLHGQGQESVRFFTESKVVIQRWF
ncbi:MAG: aldehyde dehydrogenase family protein, partial [Anaerolineales bacterium]|nr:aldehyde dehydrogenase family protein [Anaerolineales bacterium]